jgi:hypothetical protein
MIVVNLRRKRVVNDREHSRSEAEDEIDEWKAAVKARMRAARRSKKGSKSMISDHMFQACSLRSWSSPNKQT